MRFGLLRDGLASGIAMSTAAKIMWKASETSIWIRAAVRSVITHAPASHDLTFIDGAGSAISDNERRGFSDGRCQDE